MFCISFLILPLLLVGATSAADSDKETDGYGTSGDMRCPRGTVFTVVFYDELTHRLEMKCAPALICGVPGDRIGSRKRCRKDGEFMFKADEKTAKSGNVVETCNRYKLPPKRNYTQVCKEFYIKDQEEEETGPSGGNPKQSRGGRRHFNMTQLTREKILERFPNFGGNRSQRLQKRGIKTTKEDIYKGELLGEPQMSWMIKEISRRAKRYKVVGCKIYCSGTIYRSIEEEYENSKNKTLVPQSDDPCERWPQQILVGFAERVVTVRDFNECGRECLNSVSTFGFSCNSGMYYPNSNYENCLLNSESRNTQAELMAEETIDKVYYFECGVLQQSDETSETVNSGGGGMCFSPEVTVETMHGPIRMDQVKVGDKVLTYSAKLSIYAFDEIKYFLHREVDREANFIHIESKSGKSINLSPEHLIPTGPCSVEGMANPEQARRTHKDYTRAAKHAKTGDCLMVHTNGHHPFLDEITSVTITTKRGIFAPVTSEGNMIVNGVHASCYSEFYSYEVLRGIFGVYQNLLDWVNILVGSPAKANSDGAQCWSTVPLANELRLMIEAGKLF